jgi:hypothetical protein
LLVSLRTVVEQSWLVLRLIQIFLMLLIM